MVTCLVFASLVTSPASAGAAPDPDMLVAEDSDRLWFVVRDDCLARTETKAVDLFRKTCSHHHMLRLDACTGGQPEN
ncbi:hypothetical protein DB345_19155 [Spartobacteria bacterium LR76]|nr:hypothetical protein DB345_19155 [Spartobacteria bacterium LR76]